MQRRTATTREGLRHADRSTATRRCGSGPGRGHPRSGHHTSAAGGTAAPAGRGPQPSGPGPVAGRSCSTRAPPACWSASLTGPSAAAAGLRAVGARGIALEVLQIVGLDKRLRAYDEPAEILAELRDDLPGRPTATATTRRQRRAGPAAATSPCTVCSRPLAHLPADAAGARRTARAGDRGQHRRSPHGWPAASATAASRSTTSCRWRWSAWSMRSTATTRSGAASSPATRPRRSWARSAGTSGTRAGASRCPAACRSCRLQVNRAKVELSQTWPASPTIADIARHLDITEEDVAEAIEVARLYNPVSLSAPAGPDTDLARGPDRGRGPGHGGGGEP